MVDVLLTHSYHLPYDPKQVRKMQPYAPLGTLYAASALRAGNISVAVFDAEVNSWRKVDSSETVDAGLLWQHVFDLEPKARNPEAAILAQSTSDGIRTQRLVPLHALAAAGRQI
jgi:hypothetical protein